MEENASNTSQSNPASEMPGNQRHPRTPHATPGESLHAVQRKFDELLQYISYFAAAKIDLLGVAIRRRVAIAAAISVGVLAAAGAIVTAVVLLCEGICDGLSELFGHRWIGELATAAILLGVVAGATSLILYYVFAARKRETVARYEALRRRQQRDHHRDVQHPLGGAPQGHSTGNPKSNPGPERR